MDASSKDRCESRSRIDSACEGLVDMKRELTEESRSDKRPGPSRSPTPRPLPGPSYTPPSFTRAATAVAILVRSFTLPVTTWQ